MAACTSLRIFAASLLPLLAGCSVRLAYPDAWPPLQASAGECPALAGTYAELGETTSACAAGEPCARLPFELFSAVTGSEEKASLAGTRVEVRQPSAGLLEIVVLDGAGERGRGSLSAARGEFSCTPRGLAVIPRGGRAFVIGGARIFEERTFNRARDGSLVMLREALGSDEGAEVPVVPHARYWVRWAPQ